MKSVRQKSNKRKVVAIVGIVVVVLIGLAIASYFLIPRHRPATSTSVKQDSSTKASIDSGAPSKGQVDNGNSLKATNADNAKADTTPPSQAGLSVSVTAFENSPGNIHISGALSPSISSGSCTVTLTQGSITRSFTTAVQFSGSSSTCNYDVSTSSLAANPSGTWQVKLSATANDTTATATTTVDVS